MALADKEDAMIKALAAKATSTVRSKGSVSGADAEPTLPAQKQQPLPPPQKRPPAVQHAPVFASQSDDVEFTETEHERFHMENVTLHRHFQENLEDAK
jgi:hypothetical protein